MFSLARLDLFLLVISLLLLPAHIAMAQNPIRVQSDQVLVPTVVFDQKLYAQLNKMEAHHRDYYGRLLEKNEKLWDNITVKNLTAKDFHLYEDGHEQKIQSVRLESPVLRVVEDNLGKHPETIGTGGGVWSYPDLPAAERTTWLALPQYAIAYAPAKSTPGSCHQIQVKAGRVNLVVWSRSEYCNTPHPPTDPLNGSALGKKLEEAMVSDQQDKIELKMKVAAFAAKASGARVYITLDFPWRSLKHEYRGGTLYATIGMLIVVYNKDGTVAARRSDFACCDYGDEKQANPGARPMAATEGRSLIPDRYRTDFNLAAGDYNVRVVLSDGENFGRQQAQLTVQHFDPEQLGISDVVLSRRVRRLPADTADSVQAAESYTPLVSKGVEFTPTANTEFRRDETLVAFFEINVPPEEPNTKVQAHLRIVDAQSGEVITDFDPVDAAIYQRAGNQAIAMGRGMPLSGLLVGPYHLEAQASEASGRTTPWQTAEFTVVPAARTEKNPEPPKKDEVIIHVSALDSNGHAVTDLTSEDFQIVDGGKPQTIASFKVVSAQSAPTPQARMASEGRSDGDEGTDRKTRDLKTFVPPIVILFDLMNTTWSRREYIANRLIKVLDPLQTDEGIYLYLLTTDGELYPVRPNGTGQAAAIEQGSIAGRADHEKFDDVPWTKAIRPLLMDAINEMRGFRDEDPQTEAWRAPLTFRRLSELEDEFSAVRGPKTLLWITGGVPTTVPSFCENNVISSATGTYVSGTCSVVCQLPKAADMAAIMGSCMDYTPFLEHFSAEAVSADTTVSSVAVTATGLQDFEVGKRANSLARLAELTGGEIYMNTDADVEKAIRKAVEARKARYRLTFAAPVRDGKYHELRVLCTRPGAHVAGPHGYFAVAR
jgi:VWFA-related protein